MPINIGYAFESEIEKTNEEYKEQKIALIKKRPTPTVHRGRKLFLDSKKATVDFEGVYKGRSIQFEAKSVMENPYFSLDLIKDHQYEHLLEASSHGAICFLLVFMGCNDKIYLITTSALIDLYKRLEEDGIKRLDIDEFDEYSYEVGKGRTNIDYLKVVEEIYPI